MSLAGVLVLPLTTPANASIFDFIFGDRSASRRQASGTDRGGGVRSGRIIGATNPDIPYILSPRNTYLLGSQFVIAWNPVPEAQAYQVKLWRWADGYGQREWLVWEAETTAQTQVIYDSQVPLSPARYYSVEVIAITPEGEVSSDQDLGCAAIGFSLLFSENAALLEAALAQANLPEALLPEALTAAAVVSAASPPDEDSSAATGEPMNGEELASQQSSPARPASAAVDAAENVPAGNAPEPTTGLEIPLENVPVGVSPAEESAPTEDTAEAISLDSALVASDIYLRYGLLDLALRALQTPEAGASSTEINLALADLYSYAGLTSLALERYTMVLQLEPEPLYAAVALEGRGILQANLGLLDTAGTSLQEAETLYQQADQLPAAAAVDRRLRSLAALQAAAPTPGVGQSQPGQATCETRPDH